MTIEELRTTFTSALAEELDYRLDLAAETAVEEGEAFARDDGAVYRAMCDLEVSDMGQDFLKEMRTWMIAHGVYRALTQDEIDRTFVSRGRAYDFKMKGVAYRFDHHLA